MSPSTFPNPAQFVKNTLAETFEMEFIEIQAGKVVMTMPVGPKVHQPMGLLHGGASVALAETIASAGGYFLVAPKGKVVVGQEINANHLRSVREGKITGVGECVYQGKISQVWEIKIYDDSQRLICISRCTLAVIEQR